MNKYKFEKGFNARRMLVILSVLFIISYGIFNARHFLTGPTIEIWSPENETKTEETILTIKGRAKNITAISLNERPIFVDTEGIFQEKLLLSPGFNIIEIKAQDRFKQETVETVKVYYSSTTRAIAPEE